MRGLTHVKLAFRAPRCAQASVKLLLLLAQCTLQKAVGLASQAGSLAKLSVAPVHSKDRTTHMRRWLWGGLATPMVPL